MNKVIGMDLGDKRHVVVVFDEGGEEIALDRIVNTSKQVQKFFSRYPGAVVAMEAGTHSPWISRLLESMGHPVVVGNPRKLRAIWDSTDKSDERDARILAMMYRLEPRLLHPIHHRSERAQVDLGVIKARMQLVECRSKLVNHVRCTVKAMGQRIPSCSAEAVPKRAPDHLPEELADALKPVLETIAMLTLKIRRMDRRVTELCKVRYPETKILQQVPGVGPLTALSFVLTIEEPTRFSKSRSVGAFVGLTSGRDQSGETDKQLPITKAGNTYLRQLLVGSAHYILGAHGPDCDLRRFGERLASRGGKSAKKRAVVAVARKLSVLMHRMWVDQSTYKPFRKDATTWPFAA